MAGQWEPVSGVFWSAPPAVPDEGWPLSVVIISALVLAFAVVAVVNRIAQKIKPGGWHLRQHLGEIGGALTLVYLVVVIVVTWSRIGALITMPLNEVGDFLAGAFGPVGFLWLVFGFIQQGDELRQGTEALKLQADELQRSTQALEMQAIELRNSVEQQSIMAEAALDQIKAQRAALQMQLDEREKALMANFSIRHVSSGGGGSNGMEKNTIRIWNEGAHATELAISFEPQIPGAHLLKLGDMRANASAEHTFFFPSSESPDEGVAHIAYLDTEGTIRHQSFAYTLDRAKMKYRFKRVHDKFR